MYIPPSFRVEDRETLHAFMERYSFATLVSIRSDAPFATHLPLLLDRDRNTLLGHLARGNPHAEALGGGEWLAVFSGPHAYVSPSWYAVAPAVPTWNYAVVHAYGTPRKLSADRTRTVVDETVRRYESTRDQPWANDLPEEYRQRMLDGVVGFEMPILRIEGKFKLGQNRDGQDRAGMVDGLMRDGAEARLLADLITKHFAAEAPGRSQGSTEPR